MKTQQKAQYFLLKSMITASVFIMGCSTLPLSKQAPPSHNIEGKWSWQQDGPGGPWHGDFVIEKEGKSYAGTLNDLSENNNGDKITDVKISDKHIKFTRQGRFSVQHWEGDLEEENSRLKIINGQWTDSRWGKDPDPLSFSAEKED